MIRIYVSYIIFSEVVSRLILCVFYTVRGEKVINENSQLLYTNYYSILFGVLFYNINWPLLGLAVAESVARSFLQLSLFTSFRVRSQQLLPVHFSH